MNWQAEVLCPGTALGETLRLDAPISFWGGIDPIAARVTLAGHPQLGMSIEDRILVIPHLVGSSSSSAVLLELLYAGRAPSALILGARDAILPVAVVVAGQMEWPTIPVLVLPDPPLRTGDRIAVRETGRIERV